MRILSIETSCDDTAAAIVEWTPSSSSADEFAEAGGSQTSVLANVVSTQTIHAQWGGVVPNLASREHLKNIVPVIEETLNRAKCTSKDIDLIAVTEGPGLMPALLVGVSAAKTLALIWGKPLIGINHLEGHIYANFIPKISKISNSKFLISKSSPKADQPEAGNFPLLALIVSGGHTQLVLMQKHFDYTILGETQDDAAGEAFDKVAKLLGLPYPGGPLVAQKADTFRAQNFQFLTRLPARQVSNFPAEAGLRQGGGQTNPNDQNSNVKQNLFPRPMLNSDDFNFSFSGLKTAVLYFLKKHAAKMSAQGDEKEWFIDMVCHEFQEAVVDVLVAKTKKALELYSPKTLVIAGGVSANLRLREQLQSTVDALNLEVELPNQEKIAFITPEFSYSCDNAAMIGIAAAFRYAQMDEKQRKELMKTSLTLDPDANLPLQNLAEMSKFK